MNCPNCGSRLIVADKPSGFLRLYGAHCPIDSCNQAELRRQSKQVLCVILGCVALIAAICILGIICQ